MLFHLLRWSKAGNFFRRTLNWTHRHEYQQFSVFIRCQIGLCYFTCDKPMLAWVQGRMKNWTWHGRWYDRCKHHFERRFVIIYYRILYNHDQIVLFCTPPTFSRELIRRNVIFFSLQKLQLSHWITPIAAYCHTTLNYIAIFRLYRSCVQPFLVGSLGGGEKSVHQFCWLILFQTNSM